jgi:hypothetical protein
LAPQQNIGIEEATPTIILSRRIILISRKLITFGRLNKSDLNTSAMHKAKPRIVLSRGIILISANFDQFHRLNKTDWTFACEQGRMSKRPARKTTNRDDDYDDDSD